MTDNMDGSNSFLAGSKEASCITVEIPLESICNDEDCTLPYIHAHEPSERSSVKTESHFEQVVKSVGFVFICTNFLIVFWGYVFVAVIRVAHFFNINITLHLPFNLHLPFLSFLS